MTKKHAKFGSPSTLYRTNECPGWVSFSRNEPSQPESPHALEGTIFHQVMEVLAPSKLHGNTVKFPKIPEEYDDMQEYVDVTLQKVHEAYKRFKENHVEVSTHFELKIKVNDDIFGTSDVVFVGKHKKTKKWNVVCIDYKYGRGVPVSAEENLQGIAYGLGAINTIPGLLGKKIGVCMIMIAQVRLDPEWLDNPKSRYTFEGDEIGMYLKKIEAIVAKAKKIYEGKAPQELKGGSHCRFCPMSGKCPAEKTASLDAMTVDLEELPDEAEQMLDTVKRLTLDEQVKIFLLKSKVEDFLNSVAANLTAAFQTGIVHPELKLIQTKGRRSWNKEIDEEKIAKTLVKLGIKDPYNKKLIGITEAAKKVKKGKTIDSLVVQGTGRIELVHVNHPSPAIAVSGAEELPE